MQLSGQQYEELCKAIENAYRTRDDLKHMIRFKFNENLDAISKSDSYSNDIFNVVEHFDSQSRVLEFVEKAHESNPGNQKLKTCYQRWCSNQPVDEPETIEQITKHLSELLANQKWEEADTETSNILLKAAKQEKIGWLQYEDIEQLDCQLLLKIDELWRNKSDNRFGFRIQKEIWEQLQKNFKANLTNTKKEFGKKLCWYVDEKGGTGRWISRVEINPSWGFDKSIEGYLPTPPPCIQGKNPIKIYLTLALVKKLRQCQQ